MLLEDSQGKRFLDYIVEPAFKTGKGLRSGLFKLLQGGYLFPNKHLKGLDFLFILISTVVS